MVQKQEVTLIQPDWALTDKVGGLVTTRPGGVSPPPYDSFNLALHVEDEPGLVLQNRRSLHDFLPAGVQVQWLKQVHGTRLIKAGDTVAENEQAPEGDAVYIDTPGIAGAIMTADCLPVFLAAETGAEAAVVHAGWRGLCNGVLEAALYSFKSPATGIHAWLGPAIGPCHFEVGHEVRQAFLDVCRTSGQADQLEQAFHSGSSNGKWMADLYALATLRLQWAGVTEISGGSYCTFCDSDLFYSYRRSAVTGRMASLVYLQSATQI